MRHWETHDRIIRLSVTVIVALILATLLAVAFLPPPAHDVHTPGAIAIEVHIAAIPPTVTIWRHIGPSQSLAEIRCQAWHEDVGNSQAGDQCPDGASLALRYWPKLKQSSKALYIGSCDQSLDVGVNVEYLVVNRTLTIHCYSTAPWIAGIGHSGAAALCCFPELLVISTNAIRSGSLSIIQDDRIERLFSDQSREFQLATATIS
jgi:hypothetical protein